MNQSRESLLRAGRPSDAKKTATLSSLADKGGDVRRVNFDIPRAEYTKLKIYAATQERTISEIMRELVAQLLVAKT